MTRDPDNPPYLTVVKMVNGYHVDLMEYIRGEYMMSKSTFPMEKKEQAQAWAQAWSEREGLEVR